MKRLTAFALVISLVTITAVFQSAVQAEPAAPDAVTLAPTWGAIIRLTNDNNTPAGALEPRVAISPDGSKLMVAFIRGDTDTIIVNPYYVESSNNGNSWSNNPLPIHISSGPILKSLHLDVTYDTANKRHAVWREGDDLVYKHGNNWGASGALKFISQPTPLTSVTGASNPSIAATGSNTLDVIWSEDTIPFNQNIRHARSIDSGANWSTPQVVANTNPSSLVPALAVDQVGRLHAVWEETTVPGTTIFYSQGTPGSGTSVAWSTPISITVPGSDETRQPEITVRGTTLHVSYSRLHLKNQQQETADHVMCSSQCTNRNNWHTVSTSGQFVGVNVNFPNDTIVSDVVYANGCTYVYYDGTSNDFPEGKNIIWGVNSCSAGRDKVTDQAIQANNPSLAANGQWIHLAFEQYTSAIKQDYAHIYYVRGKALSNVMLPVITRR